jgi:uncharacterized protein YhaN
MTASTLAADASASPVALQFVAIFAAGGLLPLVIFLLRRKSELRNLDSTSRQVEREGESSFIDRVLASEKKTSERANELEDQIKAQRKDFTRDMQVLQGENERLSTEVAKFRTDLGIAQRQVKELERQLSNALNTADQLRQLWTEVRAGSATGRRIEEGAAGVASDLAARQRRDDATPSDPVPDRPGDGPGP